MIAQKRYRISGRVQGVGFRWFTREAATELRVSGTVRNAPDGTVEVTARAPADALAAFEDRLRTGPPTARVERIEVLESTEAAGEKGVPREEGEPEEFRIIR